MHCNVNTYVAIFACIGSHTGGSFSVHGKLREPCVMTYIHDADAFTVYAVMANNIQMILCIITILSTGSFI